MIVALHGVEFFAYHGFYPEEQKIGNTFIVDIEVEFAPGDNMDDELDNTVNYELLFDIVNERMKVTSKLIETVAQGVVDDIKRQYAFVTGISVSIKKLNPLIGAKVKYSEVIVNYKNG